MFAFDIFGGVWAVGNQRREKKKRKKKGKEKKTIKSRALSLSRFSSYRPTPPPSLPSSSSSPPPATTPHSLSPSAATTAATPPPRPPSPPITTKARSWPNSARIQSALILNIDLSRRASNCFSSSSPLIRGGFSQISLQFSVDLEFDYKGISIGEIKRNLGALRKISKYSFEGEMATEKEAKRVISESSEVEKDGGEEEKEVEGAGMWSWGAGTDGQLGTGNLEDEYLPQSIALPSTFPISRVACGGAHSIALTGDGRVLSWGRGSKGQLGHGALVNCLKPKFVKSLESYIVSDVSAGWNHSGFVTGSGRLLMCGDGSFGQLGNGDHQSHSSPIEVLYFVSKHVEQIACGMRHSLVLVREHQENIVSGFGSTRHGQIGAPLYVTSRSRSISLPKEVQGFENHKIIDIFANGDQSAALSVDGQLYTWGRGFNGRLGSHSPQFFPSSLRFSQVSLGWNHALLLADGEAFMLGGKHHGMLSSSQLVKIQQQQSTCVEYSDESLLAPPLERVSCIGEEKVVHIAAGAEHSALVTEKGKIMTWGWGEHGQLGFGDTKDQTLPCTVNIGYKGCVDGSQVKVHCGSGYTLVVKSA